MKKKMNESREEIGPSASQNKISQGDPTSRLGVFYLALVDVSSDDQDKLGPIMITCLETLKTFYSVIQ